jgi:hypothetical protein
MNKDFERYRFRATSFTADAAVLHCLKGLCQWVQRGERNQQIGAVGKRRGTGAEEKLLFVLRVLSAARHGAQRPMNYSLADGLLSARMTVTRLLLKPPD